MSFLVGVSLGLNIWLVLKVVANRERIIILENGLQDHIKMQEEDLIELARIIRDLNPAEQVREVLKELYN